MEKCWRWFGQNDVVKLSELRQMDVEGVVTSLHDVKAGDVWSKSLINERKSLIEKHGMRWSVVESLPVSEGIKQHNNDYDQLISNYIISLKNLGESGIKTVCYNFMPALDWARTDLHYTLPSGGEVMYFDYYKFVAFDVFILERPGAQNDYDEKVVARAKVIFDKLAKEERSKLAYNIIVYTQGFIHGSIAKDEKNYKKAFLDVLANYNDLGTDGLRQNLFSFLRDVIPVAENYGINMCIHADDPPFPLLGLPRIVSSFSDLEDIFSEVPSLCNGLTFCSGSLSASKKNDLHKIMSSYIERIHFLHLRNNIVFNDGSFHESGHIDGDVNIPALVKLILIEQKRRKQSGRSDFRIPVRPDHGIKMLGDFQEDAPPGYPTIGRMRGLMELKGIEAGVAEMLGE